MKCKIIFIILISCFGAGCGPTWRLYVKNSTDRNVDLNLIQVKVYDQFVFDTTYTLYANFEQDLIDNVKWSTAKRLTQNEKIRQMNDSSYHISLCSHSTYLIVSGRFIPFEKIIVNQEHRTDTLIMYGNNRNVRKNMEGIKVRNKGFFRVAKVIELL